MSTPFHNAHNSAWLFVARPRPKAKESIVPPGFIITPTALVALELPLVTIDEEEPIFESDDCMDILLTQGLSNNNDVEDAVGLETWLEEAKSTMLFNVF